VILSFGIVWNHPIGFSEVLKAELYLRPTERLAEERKQHQVFKKATPVVLMHRCY
jgi:hypothetical protein